MWPDEPVIFAEKLCWPDASLPVATWNGPRHETGQPVCAMAMLKRIPMLPPELGCLEISPWLWMHAVKLTVLHDQSERILWECEMAQRQAAAELYKAFEHEVSPTLTPLLFE